MESREIDSSEAAGKGFMAAFFVAHAKANKQQESLQSAYQTRALSLYRVRAGLLADQAESRGMKEAEEQRKLVNYRGQCPASCTPCMSILPDRDPGTDEPYPAGLMGPKRLGIAYHATHTAINSKAQDRDCDGLRGPQLDLIPRGRWLRWPMIGGATHTDRDAGSD